jgi:hypothetical protein
MSTPQVLETTMDAISLLAVLGLSGLGVGVVLVNVVSTPRAALIGTIVAAIGVLMLAVVAVSHLVG